MNDSRKKLIKNRIREIVKYIWLNDLYLDYENGLMDSENTFKNAFYFHLRNYLKYEIERDNLRIYADYYVKEADAKSDIVIAHLNKSSLREIKNNANGDYYYSKGAVEVLATFDMKYRNYAGGISDFCNDIDKIERKYSRTRELYGSEFYVCYISEIFYKRFSWVSPDEARRFGINEMTAVLNEKENSLVWHAY